MEHRDSVFTDTVVRLDGNHFFDCTFGKNCTIQYAGGAVHLDGCSFEADITWAFDGNLGNGLETLRTLAHHLGPKSVKAIADMLASGIRRKNKSTTVTIN